MRQNYTILSGNLDLHIGEKGITLHPQEKYVVKPRIIHWAKSNNECWVEIYSRPGWTKEDHILAGKS
jgi:mannose-6-phosphate isomerase-like protein (cupin superfamily)